MTANIQHLEFFGKTPSEDFNVALILITSRIYIRLIISSLNIDCLSVNIKTIRTLILTIGTKKGVNSHPIVVWLILRCNRLYLSEMTILCTRTRIIIRNTSSFFSTITPSVTDDWNRKTVPLLSYPPQFFKYVSIVYTLLTSLKFVKHLKSKSFLKLHFDIGCLCQLQMTYYSSFNW